MAGWREGEGRGLTVVVLPTGMTLHVDGTEAAVTWIPKTLTQRDPYALSKELCAVADNMKVTKVEVTSTLGTKVEIAPDPHDLAFFRLRLGRELLVFPTPRLRCFLKDALRLMNAYESE